MNYTFFQFGPLDSEVGGKPCMAKALHCTLRLPSACLQKHVYNIKLMILGNAHPDVCKCHSCSAKSFIADLPACIPAGRPLIMVAGQGATATVWTPDLLQTLAQTRQVTIFTNRGVGLSTDAQETEASSVAGMSRACDLPCTSHLSLSQCSGPCL